MTLAFMALSGIGMGAAFDGYRVAAHELRIGRLWIPVLDLLYWVAAALIVFRVLIAVNEGEVRMPVFLGLMIGLSFYFWLLSRPIIRLYRLLAEAMRRMWQLAVSTVNLLVVRPLLGLVRLVRIILGLVVVTHIYLLRFMLQLFRPILKLAARIAAPAWLPISRKTAVWAEKAGLRRLKDGIIAMINRWRNRRS